MLFSAILEFIRDILSGELIRIWRQHKLNEAVNVQNKIDSLSDDDVDKRLHDWIRD